MQLLNSAPAYTITAMPKKIFMAMPMNGEIEKEKKFFGGDKL